MTELSIQSSAVALELPRGLALNRFHIDCPGLHKMTRIPRPAAKEETEKLEQSIGQSVFRKGAWCYAGPAVSLPSSTSVDLPCSFDLQLHAFDLRRCIFEHAVKEKLDARFGFAREISITGLAGDVQIDGLLVQRRLRLRVVVMESFGSPDTWVVGRQDTRYLVAGSLANAPIRERAIGEIADRLAGDGPLKGEVVAASDGEVTLLVRGDEVSVRPSDYTLTVRVPYIRRYHRRDTLQRLQVISGSLTQTGRKNRYAVKDRYKGLIDAMEQLGYTIPMPDGRYAKIDRAWTEIRIQEGIL